MKTFKFELGLDMKVVVPQQFTEDLRKEAIAEDSTEFLKQAHAAYPEDDEQFLMFVLKNGIRKQTRQFLAHMFESSGLGCTLAPARMRVIDRSPPHDVDPVLPAVVDQVVQA